jgi:hypothetical protein
VPFDPETDVMPAALETLWSRADEQGPALVLAIGEKAQRDGWAARAAIALATAWMDRGFRIVLADLALDSPSLHIELGEANTDGIADIFQFGASVRRMARVIPGRGFRFLPAGAYVPDSAEILRSPGWAHLIGQFSEDHSLLLAYLPADAVGGDELARRLGRAIVLAGSEEVGSVAARLAGFCTVELVLSPPSALEPFGAAAGSALPSDHEIAAGSCGAAEAIGDLPDPAPRLYDTESGATEPFTEDGSLTEPPLLPRKWRRRRRVSPVLLLLLIVALVVGGGTILHERDLLPEWIPVPEWFGLRNGGSESSTTLTGEKASPEPGAELPPASLPRAAEPVESPIPYSVAVEAHQDYATAIERVTTLRRIEPGVAFFLTPIPNQGVVYYRLLAGPVADTAAAWSLMQRLVAARQKTDLDPWSIRPTVWAFHLGDFETAAEAAARAEELQEAQVPTYLVEIEYTAGPPRHRLYAGAYEGPGPTEVMRELLRAAGIEAPLVRRQGKPIQ